MERDTVAARLITVAKVRDATRLSEKQWAAIHGFVTQREREGKIVVKELPLDQIVDRLKDRMTQVCDALISDPHSQRRGMQWRYGKKGSLVVHVSGPKVGMFMNFETGEKGGPLQLIQAQQQCDLPRAIEWAKRFVGGVDMTVYRANRPQPMTQKGPEEASLWVSQRPESGMLNPVLEQVVGGKKMLRKHQETARYTYTDGTGHPLFYVVRLEPLVKDGTKASKMTLPMSYGSEVGKGPMWRLKKYMPMDGSKSPLYNLAALMKDPDRPVLVVEGEKAADAAQRMFPDYVVMTWQGGASAMQWSDWTPMKHRKIVIWPDNDSAGVKAAADVKARCEHAGAFQVEIVSLAFGEKALPEKWDLADALPEGITQADLRQKVKAAATRKPVIDLGTQQEATRGFELGDDDD